MDHSTPLQEIHLAVLEVARLPQGAPTTPLNRVEKPHSSTLLMEMEVVQDASRIPPPLPGKQPRHQLHDVLTLIHRRNPSVALQHHQLLIRVRETVSYPTHIILVIPLGESLSPTQRATQPTSLLFPLGLQPVLNSFSYPSRSLSFILSLSLSSTSSRSSAPRTAKGLLVYLVLLNLSGS